MGVGDGKAKKQKKNRKKETKGKTRTETQLKKRRRCDGLIAPIKALKVNYGNERDARRSFNRFDADGDGFQTPCHTPATPLFVPGCQHR